MNYAERLRDTAKRFTSNQAGFGQAIIFTPPGGAAVTVYGLHVKTKLGLDTDYRPVVVKRASVTVSEELLTAQGYPVRSGGEVIMTGHMVEVADSTGTVCTYQIRERYPDETIGILVFILDEKAT